jgi:hypothetical protein
VDNDVDSCSFTPRTSDQRWWQVGGCNQEGFRLGPDTFSRDEFVLLCTILLLLHRFFTVPLRILRFLSAIYDSLYSIECFLRRQKRSQLELGFVFSTEVPSQQPRLIPKKWGKLCLNDCSHGGEGEAVATLITRQFLPTPIPPSKHRQNICCPLPYFHSSFSPWRCYSTIVFVLSRQE